MSYLDLPRITFAGLFQADVNTVNNDVRNYDSRVFEPRLQTPQRTAEGRTEYNGWWNPDGSNAFRLLQCTVTGAVDERGAPAAGDPALTITIDAQRDRTAAKIIDLDPQFQMASCIWGMRLFLSLGGETCLSATLRPACFRDIYFARMRYASTGKPVPRSPGASARFTGALEELAWSGAYSSSPLLRALAHAAELNEGRLQLSLMTYGYTRDASDRQQFTYGSAIGSIGPWSRGEPLMFAPGRRFAPAASGPMASFASASGLGYMTAALSHDSSILSVDFGNALPLVLADEGVPPDRAQITVAQLGPLTVAVLKEADHVAPSSNGSFVTMPAAIEGEELAPERYDVVGVLRDYDAAWLQRTGGIADLTIPTALRARVLDRPLLILRAAREDLQTVAIRETTGGMWVRADDFVQRVDAAPTGWVESEVTLYAMRYGRPWPSAPIDVSILPKQEGQGGTDDDTEVKPPQATIPAINTPADKVSAPSRIRSGADGRATLRYGVENPNGVRGYIDGQIYQIGYSIAATNQSAMPLVEQITFHVRDAFEPPEVPSWETDVAPILVQYGNLYPIMSRGLFSLADPSTLAEHARLLQLAFTRAIEDPNYMPATRDLSAGKLRTIVKWLASYLPSGVVDYGAIPPLPVGGPKPTHQTVVSDEHPSTASERTAKTMLELLGRSTEGKNAAVRTVLRAKTNRA